MFSLAYYLCAYVSYLVAEERFITFIICGTKRLKGELFFCVYMHSCKMF